MGKQNKAAVCKPEMMMLMTLMTCVRYSRHVVQTVTAGPKIPIVSIIAMPLPFSDSVRRAVR